ncbi:hypothetical protein WICPIJ_006869 [Wickerhamomyces pijperi]|uniref:Uncharacterized protein n=1 Tax=Wickerhamomyces pijperi TaxID=599730 RepID=A0A9P8Q0Y8_WICPI|nr:hypothetical protein WICPIJ_006869 [Wickerhamomyces pijperi]
MLSSATRIFKGRCVVLFLAVVDVDADEPVVIVVMVFVDCAMLLWVVGCGLTSVPPLLEEEEGEEEEEESIITE